MRYTERCFNSDMRTATPSDEILHRLVHDLRQPLGNLEASLFYLEMVLEHPSDRVREQMRLMERQVAQAAQLLAHASEDLRLRRDQREGATAESLSLTNSATAALT